MKGTLVIAAILAALLVLAGCAQKAMPAEAPTATEEAVTDVGGEVSELEDLTEDLGLDELDSIEQELEDIEMLE